MNLWIRKYQLPCWYFSMHLNSCLASLSFRNTESRWHSDSVPRPAAPLWTAYSHRTPHTVAGQLRILTGFPTTAFPYIILYHPCIQDIKVIFLIYNIIFIKNIHFYNITILHILQYIIKHNRFFYHLNAVFMIYSLIFLICGWKSDFTQHLHYRPLYLKLFYL